MGGGGPHNGSYRNDAVSIERGGQEWHSRQEVGVGSRDGSMAAGSGKVGREWQAFYYFPEVVVS